MDSVAPALAAMIGTLVIGLLFFLLARELVCWYWKINEAMTTLKSIDMNLQRIAQMQGQSLQMQSQSMPPQQQQQQQHMPVSAFNPQQQ